MDEEQAGSDRMDSGAPAPGLWVHSFEEDTEGSEVYRPQDHVLPPTRGQRKMLQVLESGEIREMGPGPDDRPAPTGVTHRPLGMNRYAAQSETESGTASADLQILEATESLLRISRS